MPLDRTGPCPFAGDHWPLQWVGQNITRANFSSLNSGQKKDLIEYYYENQYATVTAPFKSRKPYRFPINQLRDYFGRVPADLKRIVKATPEYAEYVAERQRSQAPPPPPELSLLTAARIAACLTAEPPKEDEATRKAGHHFRDREERKSASVAQVVRRADREANGIRFCDGLPAKNDRFQDPNPPTCFPSSPS